MFESSTACQERPVAAREIKSAATAAPCRAQDFELALPPAPNSLHAATKIAAKKHSFETWGAPERAYALQYSAAGWLELQGAPQDFIPAGVTILYDAKQAGFDPQGQVILLELKDPQQDGWLTSEAAALLAHEAAHARLIIEAIVFFDMETLLHLELAQEARLLILTMRSQDQRAQAIADHIAGHRNLIHDLSQAAKVIISEETEAWQEGMAIARNAEIPNEVTEYVRTIGIANYYLDATLCLAIIANRIQDMHAQDLRCGDAAAPAQSVEVMLASNTQISQVVTTACLIAQIEHLKKQWKNFYQLAGGDPHDIEDIVEGLAE